jgi:hypothetical protein
MEICVDCPNEAKHKHPMSLCDKHYCDRYSFQVIDGVMIPFKKWVESELKTQGLWFKDGETRREWYARLEENGRDALRAFSSRKEK